MTANGEPPELMTLPQAAAYLQLAEKTVLRMAQRGDLPAAKVASQWRFLLPVIRDWLARQMQSLPVARLEELGRGHKGLLRVGEVIRPEHVKLNIRRGPKERVLAQLVAPLTRSGFISQGRRLLKSLLDREAMMTTAIGHGVAMPHPRRVISGLFPEPVLVLGICPAGTDFEAVDDRLVHVFFLICATRDEIHLRLMARVAWLVRDDALMSGLRGASSQQEAITLLSPASQKSR